MRTARTYRDAALSIDSGRIVDRPQPGYWMIKAVSKGPEVPACIRWSEGFAEPGNPDNEMDRPPMLVGEINGGLCDPIQVWHVKGREIDEAEYRGRVDPGVNPWQAIVLSELAVPF